MKIFEGYKKEVEIYNKHTQTQDSRGYVSKLNGMGYSEYYIPLYIVLNAYKDC